MKLPFVKNSQRRPKTNLFVYGSLIEPQIFKSVCGLSFTFDPHEVDKDTLWAEPAFLPGYRKMTPDNVYCYGVKESSSRIEGFVIHGVPKKAMDEIDWYEGSRYKPEIIEVNTAGDTVEAKAYLVSPESMKKHFGDRFHVNLIHELWLRKRIENFIHENIRPGDESADADAERRADRELLATTERDLVMTHYNVDPFSDYYLKYELDRPRPSIKQLYEDPEARPFVPNYLGLVIRHVLLDQLDEKIHDRYRYELERMYTSDRYFKRSIGLLAALQMMNAYKPAVDMVVEQGLKTGGAMPVKAEADKYNLFDYIKYAVKAADSLFDSRVAWSYLKRIRSNLQPGLTPLGMEVELSNIGSTAVTAESDYQKSNDPEYDGFKYFYDFKLDVLSWKLGGYIDDHSGQMGTSRRFGFLELAPGRLNVNKALSRPATADPWLLNQLIHEIVAFYGVKPHSLHLSFQLRKRQINNQRVLPLDYVKCLLVLGGGLEQRNTGRLWVSRLSQDEITRRDFGEELIFARTSKRSWFLPFDDIGERTPPQATTHIQQYKFIRLDPRANYEPLILGLKGLQLAYNPGDYLSAEQLKKHPDLRRDYEELRKWANEPTPIDKAVIKEFLRTIHKGLMNERHHKPAHKLHYIRWAMNSLDVQLRLFNKKLKAQGIKAS